MKTAAQRLDCYIAENRLIRKQWHDGAFDPTDGYERACLLVALAPVCGEQKSANACPASIMPLWLAHLVPWIDDVGTDDAWPRTVRTFAALAHRWHVLSPAQWRRLEYRVKRAFVIEARGYVPTSNAVLPAIDGVVSLFDRAIAGDVPTTVEWARSARSATSAARSAAESVWAAAESAWAATSAARSAAESVWAAAESAWAATSAARSAWAAEKAADKMHAEIFRLMTDEIVLAEQELTR